MDSKTNQGCFCHLGFRNIQIDLADHQLWTWKPGVSGSWVSWRRELHHLDTPSLRLVASIRFSTKWNHPGFQRFSCLHLRANILAKQPCSLPSSLLVDPEHRHFLCLNSEMLIISLGRPSITASSQVLIVMEKAVIYFSSCFSPYL